MSLLYIPPEIEELQQWCLKNINAFERLRDELMLPEAGVLIRTLKNLPIHCALISSGKLTKYTNIRDALSKLTESNVLVVLEDLELYVLFDMEINYINFIRKITTYSKESISNFSQCQIILSNKRQKIAFFMKLKNTEEEISNALEDAVEYCKKYFSNMTEKDVTVPVVSTNTDFGKEITVQVAVDDFRKCSEIITKFESSLLEDCPNISQRVRIIQPSLKNCENMLYVEYPMCINKLTDIKRLLKNCSEQSAKECVFNFYIDSNVTNTNTNSSINISGDNNSISNAKTSNNIIDPNKREQNRIEFAQRWIDMNPVENIGYPGTTSYYNTYKLNALKVKNNRPLAIRDFHKLMIEKGYENIKSKSGIHIWTKV